LLVRAAQDGAQQVPIIDGGVNSQGGPPNRRVAKLPRHHYL
jgi:hypothetical protein